MDDLTNDVQKETVVVNKRYYESLRSTDKFLPWAMMLLGFLCLFAGVYVGLAVGESNIFQSCYTKGVASTKSRLLMPIDMTCHVENMPKEITK